VCRRHHRVQRCVDWLPWIGQEVRDTSQGLVGLRVEDIAAGAVTTILLMTLFPPMIRPWWVPAAQQPATTAPLPPFAFIFDRGFTPKSGYPMFDVNRGEIAAEWIITAIVAIGLCLLMRASRSRPAA
jgi:hypothetical protein